LPDPLVRPVWFACMAASTCEPFRLVDDRRGFHQLRVDARVGNERCPLHTRTSARPAAAGALLACLPRLPGRTAEGTVRAGPGRGVVCHGDRTGVGSNAFR